MNGVFQALCGLWQQKSYKCIRQEWKKTTTLEKSYYQVFSVNEAKHFPLEYKRVKLPDYSTNLSAVHFFSWQGHKAGVSDITTPPSPSHSPTPSRCLKPKKWKKIKPKWPVLSSNTMNSHMTATPGQTTTATVVSVLEGHIPISSLLAVIQSTKQRIPIL